MLNPARNGNEGKYRGDRREDGYDRDLSRMPPRGKTPTRHELLSWNGKRLVESGGQLLKRDANRFNRTAIVENRVSIVRVSIGEIGRHSSSLERGGCHLFRRRPLTPRAP